MIGVIKKFNTLMDKRQKKRIGILFVITLVGAFLEVLGVGLMLPLVTAIMQPDIIERNEIIKWVCGVFDLHSHRTFVIVCIAALILVFIFKDFFLMAQYYVQARFVFNNRFATQQRLLHVFLNRPYEYFLNVKSGEIMRVITGDVSSTYNLLMTLLFLGTESFVSLTLTITIFIIDPFMTILMAVMLIIMLFVIAKVVRPILRKKGLEFQKHAALTNKWLIQAINGIKEIKVADKEEFFEKNYDESGRRMISAEKWNSVFGQIPRLLIEMVSVCSMLAVIALMIYFGKDINELVPTLGAFAMAAVKLMPSANRIVGAINSIAFQEPALDKLLENLVQLEADNEKYATENKREKECDLTLNNEVKLSGITYRYPNSNKNVLTDAEMLIPAGKSVGIVGTSGAGKTTAVDILLGLLRPEEGQVLTDGVDVMKSYDEWLSHIGYIPQSIFMLDGTIKENVAFAVKEDENTDSKVWHALEEAQLADFVRELPDGINTQIGERGVRLSGGQRQRIGIARALFEDPEILVFDEATSALDNETEAAIMDSINSLHGRKTLIIIAHRLQTIENCDIVYRVSAGKIKQER
ncbi:MAG: ABC transporter ATP-binding protein/permease [Lachnospiraceae bacterium]|nr:ABC transporter ATP-binding protein/permease [Lachnospiraceae bacterium]